MEIRDQVKSKNMKFKNRVVMPPMATAKADAHGRVTQEILDYYEEKTKHGLFSTVIVEHTYIEKRGKAHKNQMASAYDINIEGLKELADLIKKNGSLAILQVSHAGSLAKREVTGMAPVAPSAIKSPTGRNQELPEELTKKEIEDIKEMFIDAAIRAKMAGFDGVELHSAHGYLLNQFLSPLSNKREDEYGGELLGRIKLHLDIIKGIKRELGENYPVWIRMGAGDFIEGGLSTEDAVLAAKEFEKAGVEVVDISGGMCFYTIDETRPGYFDRLSQPIFEKVSIPVLLTGGVQKGSDIEDILARNVCDMVGVGRAVFKDSSWMENEVAPLIEKK